MILDTLQLGVRAAGRQAKQLRLSFSFLRRNWMRVPRTYIHQDERAPEKRERNPAAQQSVGDSDPGTVNRTERRRAAVLAQHEL